MANLRINLALIAVILCAAIRMHADPAPTLAMTVNASTVTISGATPHGNVIFLGVGAFIDRTTVTIRRLDQAVVDEEGDGGVGRPVPWKSISAAVDLMPGRYVLVAVQQGWTEISVKRCPGSEASRYRHH